MKRLAAFLLFISYFIVTMMEAPPTLISVFEDLANIDKYYLFPIGRVDELISVERFPNTDKFTHGNTIW